MRLNRSPKRGLVIRFRCVVNSAFQRSAIGTIPTDFQVEQLTNKVFLSRKPQGLQLSQL